MVVTHAGANKQMEEELVALKTKLQDLVEKILSLHLQHSTINNKQQLESSAYTGFSSSNKFRGLKLDFPCFNGDDPTGWIYKVEQYFSLHDTFDVNKVSLASFHLEHESFEWFCWYIKAHIELDWTDLCQLLL